MSSGVHSSAASTLAEHSPVTRPKRMFPATEKPAESYTPRKYPWRFHITPFERIVNHHYPGSGTEEDPYIVDWLRDDPEDPQTWPIVYKWTTILIAAMATLAVALASSAYSGGVNDLAKEFGASRELLIAGVSFFVVGFAFGPLMWAPASEVWGRREVFILSYSLLTLWQGVTAAAQNIATVLVFRFFSGFFGSSPLANAGGVISDVMDANSRGLGMAIFAAAPFLGPSLGPITGGFLGLTSGWRWIEGYLAIFSGVLTIVLFFFMPETYAPFLLRKRAAKLSKATGKVYRFGADRKGKLQIGQLYKAALLRPWKFLIFEPIVTILTIYTAVIYGVLYLNFAAYPIIFQQQRGWNTGVGGLAFLGILVGTVISVLLSVFVINPQYLKVAKSKGGRAAPEDRLPPAIWGGILIVIGLAGFAATDGPNVHWIAPIIFGIPFGTGVIVVFLAVLSYLIDSYTIYAASVLAANSVLRSLFGAAFPLFTSQMYEALGVHWAAALPGFIALACVPFVIMFYKYGAKIRAKCKYSADAERQMAAIMAARMAAAKDDEESAVDGANNSNGTTTVGDSDTDQSTSRDVGAKTDAVGGTSTGINEKEIQTAPAENIGGAGNTEVEAINEKEHAQHAHQHHEWTMYEALADRDEVDLSDEERIKLQDLHQKFNFAKAKSTTNQ